MEYTSVFQSLGLVQNEAKIYETLLREGEAPVGLIAEKSGVHRRNVYDTLNRLMEKGLAVEIRESNENRYQAVEPRKLSELLSEKWEELDKVMPSLEKLYHGSPAEYTVYTYRGKEGWKNYMRDIIKTGEPFYSIGAQGAWLDERVKSFFPGFMDQMKKKKIPMHHLFDHEVLTSKNEIVKHVGKNYKFLPKKYSTTSGIDVFGDHVNIMHEQNIGKVGSDSEIIFTVIVNKSLADSYRTWFQYMWDTCPKK